MSARQEHAVLPTTFGQESMRLAAGMTELPQAYTVPVAVGVDGELDVGALRLAVAVLGDRHESLRACFPAGGPAGTQVVAAPGTAAADVVAVEAGSWDEALAVAARQVAAPFDLGTAPLWRVCAVRVSAVRWLLVITAHHLVCDGWSLGVLLSELAQAYGAARRGTEPGLAPLAFDYGDYAAWQRRQAGSGPARQSLRFWRDRLAGAPVLDLVPDRPRPAVLSLRGGAVRLPLPEALSRQLTAFGRARGLTAYMTGLAAFVAVLARWSGQHDICVGTPVTDRTAPGTESLVGFLVNSIVLRFAADPAASFSDLAAQARAVLLEALEHQHVPFDQVVADLAPARDLSRNPLFQVNFSTDYSPLTGVSFPGLATREIPLPTGVSKFDLSAVIETSPDTTMSLAVHHSHDVFTQPTARRFAEHYLRLLAAALTSPDTRLRDLPLADDTPAPRPGTALPRTTVTDLIEAAASDRPDAPAIRTPHAEHTYRQLNTTANQLAHRLRRHGARPGQIIALLAPRSPDAITALLAILKTGAAYLPLDPAHPTARNQHILTQARATLLLTTTGPGTTTLHPRTQPLDDPTLATEPTTNPPRTTHHDLAYIIYTSGSTGTPKGVTIPHPALLRFVWRQTYGTVSADQVRLHLSPYTFDASVIEIWTTLSTGGCIAVPDPSLDVLAQVRQGVTELGVTTALLVSPQLHLVVDHAPALLAALDTVQVGGDLLSVAHARKAAAMLADGQLIHVYGPTECTLFATAGVVERAGTERATIPIGQPITNTRAYVLDPWLNHAPVGIPGQLYLAGPGLAWGYHRQPAHTARAFQPDPHSHHPGQRMYATGDRARWLPDGQLEFLGRLDRQIKLRGYRIELTEIEHQLRTHPAIADAAVLLRHDTPGGPALVAYLYPATTTPPTPADLTTTLHTTLPGYMIPAHYHYLDHLPLTPNGKLDHTRLTSLPPPAPPTPTPTNPPADEIETIIAGLWQAVLGGPPVPSQDKFFEVGGNSLNVVELFERLTGQFPDAGLRLVDLFKYSTIREQAARLSGRGRT